MEAKTAARVERAREREKVWWSEYREREESKKRKGNCKNGGSNRIVIEDIVEIIISTAVDNSIEKRSSSLLFHR